MARAVLWGLKLTEVDLGQNVGGVLFKTQSTANSFKKILNKRREMDMSISRGVV